MTKIKQSLIPLSITLALVLPAAAQAGGKTSQCVKKGYEVCATR